MEGLGECMARGKYEEWLEADKLLILEGWARDGLTDEQIAKNIGIRRETLIQWKKKYANISNTLKRGKEVVDREVENALLKSALGHVQTIRKPIKVKTEKSVPGKGKVSSEKIVYAEEEIYIPPNVTAQIFWLKNRKPDDWREKREHEQVIEAFEDDGLIAALTSAIDFEMEDDSDFLPQEDDE